MYSLCGYGTMIADRVRMEAYSQALRRTITPGSVILDIGTGTGILALLACRFGARRVYAIEPSNAIQVAQEIATANDYTERIEFIQDMSTRVTLPEPAHVIISDLRGVLPLFQHHILSIADARQRLLAPGGVLIPQCDTLWAAVVEAPDLYNSFIGPWNDNGYQFDMQAVGRIVTNTWRKGRVTHDQLLVEPQCWATLDYAIVERPDIGAEVTWTIEREGTGHGLNVWFDATLAEGVGFSNAPDAPELIYGSAFFPWSTPITLAAGDIVSVALKANLVGDDYIWSWDTCVLNKGHPRQIKARFKQSTFWGAPLSLTSLHKRAANHVPAINEDGQIDQCILVMMDGELSLDSIARRVLDRFPTRFAKWQDALTRVGELS